MRVYFHVFLYSYIIAILQISCPVYALQFTAVPKGAIYITHIIIAKIEAHRYLYILYYKIEMII